jgi:hypothetical protein
LLKALLDYWKIQSCSKVIAGFCTVNSELFRWLGRLSKLSRPKHIFSKDWQDNQDTSTKDLSLEWIKRVWRLRNTKMLLTISRKTTISSCIKEIIQWKGQCREQHRVVLRYDMVYLVKLRQHIQHNLENSMNTSELPTCTWWWHSKSFIRKLKTAFLLMQYTRAY